MMGLGVDVDFPKYVVNAEYRFMLAGGVSADWDPDGSDPEEDEGSSFGAFLIGFDYSIVGGDVNGLPVLFGHHLQFLPAIGEVAKPCLWRGVSQDKRFHLLVAPLVFGDLLSRLIKHYDHAVDTSNHRFNHF